MTEGLGMLTLAMRLEPSERISSVPERMRTSLMLSPESLFSPANTIRLVLTVASMRRTLHRNDFVVIDVHGR